MRPAMRHPACTPPPPALTGWTSTLQGGGRGREMAMLHACGALLSTRVCGLQPLPQIHHGGMSLLFSTKPASWQCY